MVSTLSAVPIFVLSHHELPSPIKINLRVWASTANCDQSKRPLLGWSVVPFHGVVKYTGNERADAATLLSSLTLHHFEDPAVEGNGRSHAYSHILMMRVMQDAGCRMPVAVQSVVQRKQRMSNQRENEPEELMEDAAKNDTIDAAPESEDPIELPEGAAEEPAALKRRINPVTLITLLVLAFCVVLFVWHLMADRFTPYTDQARVETFIVPIAPQVSGYLVDIPVVLHERVKEGQVLAQIDREPFELAARSARAALANAGQQVGAQTAGVESAAGRLGVSRARLERSQRNYDRVQRVSERNPGALSEADRDRAEASLEQAQAQLISSEAELERAKQTLGSEGPDNPMIESAAAALETAQFNLAQTTVTAASEGLIDSLQLDVGHYA